MKIINHGVRLFCLLALSLPLFAQTKYWIPVPEIPDTAFVYSITSKSDGTIFTSAYTYNGEFFGIIHTTDNGLTWLKVKDFAARSLATNNLSIIFAGSWASIAGYATTIISTDNGENWLWRDEFFNEIRSAIFINEKDILVTSGGVVYLSTDTSRSWLESNIGLDTTYARVLAKDSINLIYVGTPGDGIFISSNFGYSWQSVNSEAAGCSRVMGMAIIGYHYYFACSELNGVFRSNGDGFHWTPVNNGLTNQHVYSIAYDKDSIIYIGTTTGVFHSTNFGDSWNSFTEGIPDSTEILCLTAHPSGTIYAGTYGRGLYRTYQLPSYSSGWNILSIPLTVAHTQLDTLFPSASSLAYSYDGEYLENNTLQKGKGYWLKFNNLTPPMYSGSIIYEDTIEVREGWNIIGSISFPVPTDSVLRQPSEMSLSNFYQYNPGKGYSITDTIHPGLGYWVKANQNGSLILNSNLISHIANQVRQTRTNKEHLFSPFVERVK